MHELKEIFNRVEEKYQKFSEKQTTQLTDWMNSFQYNLRTSEIVDDYERQKDDLFYPDDEEKKQMEMDASMEDGMGMEMEGDVSLTDLEMQTQDEQSIAMQELEKKVEKNIENDIEIEVIKKTNNKSNKIELEINEKD